MRFDQASPSTVMVRSVKAGICLREDASLWRIAEGGQKCDIQRELVDAIEEGKKIKDLSKSHPDYIFKDIWPETAVEDTAKGEIVVFGTRNYIPHSLRGEFMKPLHSSHMSADTMYKTLGGILAWEGFKNNLRQLVANCTECTE